jgi:hypothetical protein
VCGKNGVGTGGKSSGSLQVLLHAMADFIREVEYEQQHRGEPTGQTPDADNNSPSSPPPPSFELILKRVHSATS